MRIPAISCVMLILAANPNVIVVLAVVKPF